MTSPTWITIAIHILHHGGQHLTYHRPNLQLDWCCMFWGFHSCITKDSGLTECGSCAPPPPKQCARNLIQMAAMPIVLLKIPSTYSFRSPTTNQWTTHGATQPATQCFSSHLTCIQSQHFYCPSHLLLIKCLVTLALRNSWWCWLHWCTQSDNGDCSLCFVSPLFISSPSSLCSSQTQKLSCG